MRRLIVVLPTALLLMTACGDGATGRNSATVSDGRDKPSEATEKSQSPSPSADTRTASGFDRGSAVLHGDSEVSIDLEIARTEQERALGLMHRESLPRNSGMVFVFPTETTSGFHMKNTLVPLSIAFFGDDGKILRVLDMTPCTEEPCEIYYPEITYTHALEVNRGAFDAWGVSVGDTIELHL